MIEAILSVRRGPEAIAFYKAAFGAREVSRVDNDKGEVVARLAIGAAHFWVSDESPRHANFSPETLAGSTTRMLLMVDDPDAAFARAVAAGATPVYAVGNRRGWRVGRISDPFGHHWEIGTQLHPSA